MMEVIVIQVFKFRFCNCSSICPFFFYFSDCTEKVGIRLSIDVEIFEFFYDLVSLFQIFLVLFFLIFVKSIQFFLENTHQSRIFGLLWMFVREIFHIIPFLYEIVFFIRDFILNKVISLVF